MHVLAAETGADELEVVLELFVRGLADALFQLEQADLSEVHVLAGRQ